MLGCKCFALALIAQKLLGRVSHASAFRAVVVHIAAWPAIRINSINKRSTAAGARNAFLYRRSLIMEGHVTLAAESHTVGNVVTQFRILGVGFDMVCRQATLALLALPTAVLANVAVALEYCSAPGKIFGILEAFPRAAAFPFVVTLTLWKCPVLALCIKNFSLRPIINSIAIPLSCNTYCTNVLTLCQVR